MTSQLASLGVLTCGGDEDLGAQSDCELAAILKHLRNTIDTTLAELSWLSAQDNDRITIFGPFLGRTLLEVGVTALIGRLDPMRLLVIKRTQEHGEYVTHKPWKSAMRWQGDVMADKGTKPWSEDVHYKDMTRALFGDYYASLYWRPTMRAISDLSISVTGAWLAELRATTPEEFVRTRRDLVSQLYSSTSKGVHSEFVVPPGSLYDRITISNLVTRIIQTVAELSLLANFVPHLAYRIGRDKALSVFDGIESIEVIK